MTGLTAIELINLIAAIASIVLAILAIWLSITFFRSATQAEKNTEIAINKIGEATDTLSKLSLRMIGRLTNALVTPRPAEELFREAKKNGFLTELEESGNSTKADIEQYRIDNLIAAMYYSGLSNLALQAQLPPTIGETQNLGAANLIDQSKADYDILKTWLTNTPDSNKKILKSPVSHMHTNIVDLEDSIRSTREFYAALEQPGAH